MNKTIVLGVIGSDCHSVGNKVLERFFTDNSYKVNNIGVMSTQDEFIDAAIETKADAILVSSLYGHGEIDCRGLPEKCIERGLEDTILYVGGNLVVGKVDETEVEEKFLGMGYHRVFHNNCELEDILKTLDKDISEKNN